MKMIEKREFVPICLAVTGPVEYAASTLNTEIWSLYTQMACVGSCEQGTSMSRQPMSPGETWSTAAIKRRSGCSERRNAEVMVSLHWKSLNEAIIMKIVSLPLIVRPLLFRSESGGDAQKRGTCSPIIGISSVPSCIEIAPSFCTGGHDNS